jgi:hypothetical protein
MVYPISVTSAVDYIAHESIYTSSDYFLTGTHQIATSLFMPYSDSAVQTEFMSPSGGYLDNLSGGFYSWMGTGSIGTGSTNATFNPHACSQCWEEFDFGE